jgi:hypothetical protein
MTDKLDIKISSKDFRVPPGKKVDLSKWPTVVDPITKSKKEYKQLLQQHMEKLSLAAATFTTHPTSMRCSLFFRAWMAREKMGQSVTSCRASILKAARCSVSSSPAPKSSTMIFSGAPPAAFLSAAGLASSTVPITRRCWSFGCTRRFFAAQGLPEELRDEKNIWKQRYDSIADLEKHLHRNGTQIVKIFLHLSKDEQRKRFLARIDEPDKNWKFSTSDIHERKYWKHYMKAYEDCLHATSTHHAPWYVVPADDKENARLIVSQIVLDALGDLKMAYPKTTESGVLNCSPSKRC